MRASLQRKVFYAVLLLGLMLALFFIGRPAQIAVQPGGEVRAIPGGLLAQYRTQEGLTEAQMGEIDPASNTIKLATFGMRGVAIALLWHQANEKEKRHLWNDVVAIGNQIIFLEPHFITIWDFLGWKLAYNASADFDDYRERYRWVIRGIEFLLTGLKKNQKSPILHEKVGWTISQKIGIADEVEQYRRLLRNDDAFGSRYDCPLPSDRDNWLLGRRWYHMGEALVLGGISLGNKSDFVYFANSRLNLFNYAKWRRKDGIFGEEVFRAWNNALAEWNEFGKMELATAIPNDGTFQVKKGKEDAVHRTTMEITDNVKQEEKKLLAELRSIAPDLKETLCIERWKQLSGLEQGSMLPVLEKTDDLSAAYYPTEELQIVRRWLDVYEPDWKTRLDTERKTLIPEDQEEIRKIPPMFWNEEDRAAINKTDGDISVVVQRALEMLRLTPKLLSDEIQELNVDREKKGRARVIVDTLDGHRERLRHPNLFRGILNYESRFREVAIETTWQADDAQRLRYEARKAYYDGRLADSLSGWLDAMRKWDELISIGGSVVYRGGENLKGLEKDVDFARERIEIAEKFLIILDDSNKIFPDVCEDRVPLHDMLWHKVFADNPNDPAGVEALNYAKMELERAKAETNVLKRKEDLENTEKLFLTLLQFFDNLNYREKFMGHAPFFELRDRMLETSACYIKTLEAQEKPLPEPLVLRSYVELMLKHDPEVAKANEMIIDTLPLIRENKHDEALPILDNAVLMWKGILEKYPIIVHDPTNAAYADSAQLALLYAEVLRVQKKSIPDDFPLKAFLR